jgi:hypothetical protein
VSVSIASFSLVTGTTTQLIATATMSDGLSKDVTADTQWQSANLSIATVFTGFVTAKAVGTTTITATYQSLTANGSITVTTDPVLKVTSAWCGQGAAGTYQSLGCIFVVNAGANPPSTQMSAWADFSAWGMSAHSPMSPCVGCGQLEYDFDFHVPAGATPGPVNIPFTVTDAQGRTATAVGTFVVTGGPVASLSN